VLELSSVWDMSLYVHEDCLAAPVVCANAKPADESEVASVAVEAGRTYTVVVDGATASTFGSFMLDAYFVPQN
jgi:hypothetical protein